MAIYRFWLNPFREDRSKTACWVSIDRSHLSAVGDSNPVDQALYLVAGRPLVRSRVQTYAQRSFLHAK